MSDSLLKILGM